MTTPSRTFTVLPDDEFRIDLPFDPREAFGSARAPVRVRIGDYEYRSTITNMGGRPWVPMRRSHRDATAVEAGRPFEVTLTLDTEPRTVEAPEDLRAALTAAGAWERWQTLSFTNQREHVEAVEGAKKPETRARRIEKCVEMLSER